MPIESKPFKKNFRHCELMFNESIQKEQKAILEKNNEVSDIEATKQQLILKLAFLELCGWLEVTLDNIYMSIGNTIAEKDLIERHIYYCYSFNQQSFISNLKYCLGDLKYELLKNNYDKSIKDKEQKAIFLNTLDKLSKTRNEYAHTCLDITVLPGGRPGLDEIYNFFVFLLKALYKLKKDLRKI